MLVGSAVQVLIPLAGALSDRWGRRCLYAVAPLLFTHLLAEYHDWLAPTAYPSVTGVVTLVGVALGRDPGPAEEQPGVSAPAAP